MAVSNNYVPIKQIGDGGTVNFSSITWTILAASYLKVYLEDTTSGVQTLQTLGVDYTLVFSSSGFTVTFLTPPPITKYVVINRSTALDQTNPYKTSAGYQGSVLEDSLDKITNMVQERADEAARCLKFPVGSTAVGVLPAPVDNYIMAWSGTSGKMVNVATATDLANAAANATAAAASAAAAAASAASALPNANYFASSTTGTNAYTCNTGNTAYAAGKRYVVNFSTANTNNNTTLNDNGLGARPIRYRTPTGLSAPAVGELFGLVFMVDDGTNLVIQSRHPYAKMQDVASAATTDFTQSVGDYCNLTGTTNITVITLSDRDQKTVFYTGAGLNITLGAGIALNGLTTGTLQLQTNDVFVMRREGTVTRIVGGMRASGRPFSITGVDTAIASAATTDLGSIASRLINITGTATITSFGSSASTLDPLYFIQFGGTLTLTHNATSLIIPGAANITTAAGDMAIVKYEGSGNWRVLNYVKASGQGIASSGLTTGATQATTSGTAFDFTGIPSTVKMIIVSLRNCSLASADHFMVQIGNGAIVTSGYSTNGDWGGAANTAANGFLAQAGNAAGSFTGHMILIHIGGNIWVSSGNVRDVGSTGSGGTNSGSIALGGTLDRVRLTSNTGAANYDAGSVTINYF